MKSARPQHACLARSGASDACEFTCRHPDKNLDNEGGAKTEFQRIHAAYTRLTNDEDSDDEDDDYMHQSGHSPFEDEDLAAAFFNFM